MPSFFVDPTAAAVGDGTPANPFRSWTSVIWEPGNTYLQKRNTTYSGVFKVEAHGEAAKPITVGSWFKPDGSDDPAQREPVIILPAAPTSPADGASVSVHQQTRDFVTYRNLDIRNTALPESDDVAIIWLGNNCVFENNKVTSNCGGIYIFGKHHVTVSDCVLDVVRGRAAVANHGILVADNAPVDDIKILNNIIRHHGGGSPDSHGIRCETHNAGSSITRLIVRGNKVSPPASAQANPNLGAIGMYLIRCNGAVIDRNTVSGMLTGVFLGDGTKNYVGHNDCSNNMNFGIHVTGRARSFLIERNICNRNGGDASPTFYGRGIELSSALGTHAVSGHVLRFNTCNFNRNFGGPMDNGSEGVGIGLDDATSRCLVYGNIAAHNEGNGIQLYGGGDLAKFTDTGGNAVLSNLLESNCRHSVVDRRRVGRSRSAFFAHIGLSFIYGTRTVIANNIFLGTTLAGISEDNTSSNVMKAGNVFLGVPYGMTMESGNNCFNNWFSMSLNGSSKYGAVNKTASGDLVVSPSPFVGENDFGGDPMLADQHKPALESILGSHNFLDRDFSGFYSTAFDIPDGNGP